MELLEELVWLLLELEVVPGGYQTSSQSTQTSSASFHSSANTTTELELEELEADVELDEVWVELELVCEILELVLVWLTEELVEVCETEELVELDVWVTEDELLVWELEELELVSQYFSTMSSMIQVNFHPLPDYTFNDSTIKFVQVIVLEV